MVHKECLFKMNESHMLFQAMKLCLKIAQCAQAIKNLIINLNCTEAWKRFGHLSCCYDTHMLSASCESQHAHINPLGQLFWLVLLLQRTGHRVWLLQLRGEHPPGFSHDESRPALPSPVSRQWMRGPPGCSHLRSLPFPEASTSLSLRFPSVTIRPVN